MVQFEEMKSRCRKRGFKVIDSPQHGVIVLHPNGRVAFQGGLSSVSTPLQQFASWVQYNMGDPDTNVLIVHYAPACLKRTACGESVYKVEKVNGRWEKVTCLDCLKDRIK